MSFLRASWENLVLVNYIIEPNILSPYIPKGTELDLWNGKCYVSLVGFLFKNTKLLGFKIPFHVNFEEINLRFYVKRKENNKWKKIEHLGKVILGEEVELGSNTTIDRGSVDNTVIGDNVKIDNQVHIAHNVKVGSGTAIAANSAIAGSTIVGKNCTMAGCSAIVDNVEITDEVHITAKSLITKSIKESGIYSSGTPFMKNSEWKKNAVTFKKLSELAKK